MSVIEEVEKMKLKLCIAEVSFQQDLSTDCMLLLYAVNSDEHFIETIS